MVVVWKLDRLSRRQRDGVDLLADWCDRGVRVVAVTQQIDLSGAVGRMVASVLFGLAEIESEYRRERQAAGIAVAKERGIYRGRRPGTTKALAAPCPGTPWPRPHGAGDRHRPGCQPADGLPVPGHGTGAVILGALEPVQESAQTGRPPVGHTIGMPLRRFFRPVVIIHI